ncbi:MAG: hypothetical protein DYG91_12105 [Chloroflexi bacterium CFX7]|nr:hypothetical protein [Chloroflexi bacterium CFX7]
MMPRFQSPGRPREVAMQVTTSSLDLESAVESYEERVAPAAGEPRLTTYGAPLKPLYTPLDVPGLDYLADLGLPGAFPFTRGATPAGYRGKEWTRRLPAEPAPQDLGTPMRIGI